MRVGGNEGQTKGGGRERERGQLLVWRDKPGKRQAESERKKERDKEVQRMRVGGREGQTKGERKKERDFSCWLVWRDRERGRE